MYLLEFCRKLISFTGGIENLQVVDNRDGTRSLLNGSNKKLLVTFRAENQDYDKEFFGEKDDTNMCISMHQPWASLMVHGFKRFEGRAWTTKYRGPLWVHATSQKPDPDQIDLLESLHV